MNNRLLSIILISVLLISLSACGRNDTLEPEDIIIIGEDSPQPAEQELPADVYNPARILLERPSGAYKESLYALLIYKSLKADAGEYGLDISSVINADVLYGTEVIKAVEKAERYAKEMLCRLIVLRDSLSEAGALSSFSGAAKTAEEARDDYLEDISIYEKLGISLEDLVVFHSYDGMYRYLFETMYGPGGDKEIPHSVLEETMLSRMRRIQYTYLPFFDSNTMDDYSAEKISEQKALSGSYLKRFKAGENFEDIVKENYYLLDGYGLRFSIDNVDIYYSVYDPLLPEDIVSLAERLEEGKADIVNSDLYSAVVLKLPVNQKEDERWLSTAINEEYYSSYGTEYDSLMDSLFISFDASFLAGIPELINPELVVNIINK